MIKAVLIFLVVMLVIGMIGNALFPGSLARSVQTRFGRTKPASCPKCGRYVIGQKGCDCKKDGR